MIHITNMYASIYACTHVHMCACTYVCSLAEPDSGNCQLKIMYKPCIARVWFIDTIIHGKYIGGGPFRGIWQMIYNFPKNSHQCLQIQWNYWRLAIRSAKIFLTICFNSSNLPKILPNIFPSTVVCKYRDWSRSLRDGWGS